MLGQQVSLGSARSALLRLEGAVGKVTPDALAATSEERLRAAGLTRQKSRYLVDLGAAAADGTLDLDALSGEPDERVVARLTALRGIGRWTADIYLLMGLARPDVWPASDLALIVAARTAKRLPADAPADVVAGIAGGWRPYRSTAARMLWQDYLVRRGRSLDD
ncbi:MAG: DNA-3-methyladenine glycosylase 2 family protein [Candidatus Limnocylindrales bacterium]